MKKLVSDYFDLSKEWHPDRNGDLLPENFTHGSHKKIWWICQKNHEWEASVVNRTQGTGCPYCVGKKVRDSSINGGDLNLITHILEKSPQYNQAKIAVETNSSVATVSRWKYGATIPENSKKILLKIAGLNETDLENTDFALLGLSDEEQKEWIEYLALMLKKFGTHVFNKKGNYNFEEVSKVKKMIVSLNSIGVDIFLKKTNPLIFHEWSPSEASSGEGHNKEPEDDDEEDMNPYSGSQENRDDNNNSSLRQNQKYIETNKTSLDQITSQLTFNFSILEDYFQRNIWSKKLEDERKVSQERLRNYAINIALFHIPVEDFEAAGANRIDVLKFKQEASSNVINSINEYCQDLKELGQSFTNDYFDFINKKPENLKDPEFYNEISGEDVNIDKYLSLGERKLLKQIDHNELVLKEQIKKFEDVLMAQLEKNEKILKKQVDGIETVMNELTKKLEDL